MVTIFRCSRVSATLRLPYISSLRPLPAKIHATYQKLLARFISAIWQNVVSSYFERAGDVIGNMFMKSLDLGEL